MSAFWFWDFSLLAWDYVQLEKFDCCQGDISRDGLGGVWRLRVKVRKRQIDRKYCVGEEELSGGWGKMMKSMQL